MGRKLIIAFFIIAMGIAVYLYATKKTVSLRENLSESQVKEPRVELEDFTVYRYTQEHLKGRLRARLGHLYEPN